MDFPLRIGLVHADAHGGNLVRYDSGWVLIDWGLTVVTTRTMTIR